MCLWFQLTGFDSRNSQKQPKRSQKGEKPQKIPDFIIKSKKWPKIVENGQKNLPLMKAMGFWILWSLCLWYQSMEFEAKNSPKQPKRSQNGKKPRKNTRFRHKIDKMAKNLPVWKRWVSESSDHCVRNTNWWDLRQIINLRNQVYLLQFRFQTWILLHHLVQGIFKWSHLLHISDP